MIKRNHILDSAAKMGLLALAASSFTIAQDAPKEDAPAPAAEEADPAVEEAEPAVEKAEPAIEKADPAATRSDSSYALGYRTGGSFAQEFGRYGVKLEDIEMETFMKGFTAAVKGDKPELEEERLQAAMAALGETLQQREKTAADANLEVGKKFLEENGKREGVVTTKSGLQYEVIVKGGDEKYVAPKEDEPEKQFLVNYRGTLIDGKEFDASPEGSPVPMTLQVVEGFREALTMMPVGAKWKLFIPSELAYGAERRSAEIAPNTTLIFELELVEIKDAPPAPPGGGFPIPGQ